MQQKYVYQFNHSGLYVGKTTADESPRQPGVFLMPSNSTEESPPENWDESVWPRYNGNGWDLVPKAQIIQPTAPEQKLAEFLQQNPDVLTLINHMSTL